MGLDMWAYAEREATESDEITEVIEIAYWRKLNNLHGWMENLYEFKGGREEFNCKELYLTLDDLQLLEQDLKDPDTNLPPTTGFFFGTQRGMDDEDIQSIKNFIEEAKKYLNLGYKVYYNSWW